MVENGPSLLREDGYFRALTRRGRRAKTLRAYHFELQDFGEWLNNAGVQGLVDLRRSHIEEWQDDVAARKAPKTQQVAATAIKGLLRWCADQELSMAHPMLYLRVDTPRIPPALPRPIPLRDLQTIQEALREPVWTDLLRLRTRALWWLLYSSGSRIGAVLSLNRDSIHQGEVVVTQKGGSSHTLIFSELAIRATQDYLKMRTDQEPALFIGHRTEYRQPGRRLTISAADTTWKRLAVELDVRHFSSHQIRHALATAMLRHGTDSLVIAKHLGHRSLTHVMNYAEVAMEQRREAIAALGA
jgi:site-specific recombinase XerD